MTLHYLIFDASDDGEGNGTWEAMAFRSIFPGWRQFGLRRTGEEIVA